MRILTLAMMTALLATVMPISAVQATIQPQTATSTYGQVEEVYGAVVKGWVYQNDQPVDLGLTFENTDGSDVRTYTISNTQISNKIAYFSFRDDVKNYLSTWGALSFRYPEGFMFNGSYLPAGSWKLTEVYNRNTSEIVPIKSSNTIVSPLTSLAYNEGYIDSTKQGTGITGWAYSSALSAADIAPEIAIQLSKVGTGETRTFTLPKGIGQQGYMVRTTRPDVVAFLSSQRGQASQSFSQPNTNRVKMGFLFNYNYSDIQDPSRPLTPGQWIINSITADGEAIPYGNTNQSSTVTVN